VGRGLAGAVAAVLVLAAGGCSSGGRRDAVHVGRRPAARAEVATSSPTSTIAVPVTGPPAGGRADLLDPDGRPWGAPLVFTSTVPIPAQLVFALVVGSDARPGQDVLHSHGDSIHLLAVDPATRRGTVLGFPRDSWVEIPGHGTQKLTNGLLYGPEVMARTIEHLTGLPVDYYAVTGFGGLPAMVDELGGVDVLVDRRMNDGYSGARFKPGWHHMNGQQVLNFSRDRHDVPNGDFTRSANQGKVILAALAKMRAEVADDQGVARWVDVLLRHAVLDTGLSTLRGLGALARGLDPAGITNAVVPGRVGWARGGQSVVYLDSRAAALFEDLRADAVLGSSSPPPPPPPPPPPVTTTAPATTTSTSTLTATVASTAAGQ
jgi:polyisoprenyl-teichoic acid--peptidoglycan teichoic acid transferase